MNSSECLLTILIDKVGGADRVIEYFPSDLVTEARRELYFAKITGRFLVHVLSYTYLPDTLAVILACREWHRASRDQAFWKRRIEYVEHMYHSGPTFDAFKTLGLCTTLRHQLEWLFKKGTWVIHTKDGSWRRRSIDNIRIIVRSKGSIIDISEYVSVNGSLNKTTGRYLQECRGCDSEHYAKSFFDFPTYASETGTGFFLFHSGRTFEGQCLESKEFDRIVPHGNGKWVLEDGSILEGECVAYKGEPRFIEQPPTKRIKIDS